MIIILVLACTFAFGQQYADYKIPVVKPDSSLNQYIAKCIEMNAKCEVIGIYDHTINVQDFDTLTQFVFSAVKRDVYVSSVRACFLYEEKIFLVAGKELKTNIFVLNGDSLKIRFKVENDSYIGPEDDSFAIICLYMKNGKEYYKEEYPCGGSVKKWHF